MKVQRDLDRKITVTEAGKGSPGPGRGSRVTVNKNQQCMLAVHCRYAGKGVLLLGRMFAQAAHMENREGETGREDQCQK